MIKNIISLLLEMKGYLCYVARCEETAINIIEDYLKQEELTSCVSVS